MNHKEKEFAKFAARQSARWVRPTPIQALMRDTLRVLEDSMLFGGMGDFEYTYEVERRPGVVVVTQKRRVLVGITGARVTFRSPSAFRGTL